MQLTKSPPQGRYGREPRVNVEEIASSASSIIEVEQDEPQTAQPSFFWLFRQAPGLGSQWVLFCAIFFAACCGAPLPIIGVIFGQLIASFPPPEEEMKKKLVQLMLAAVAYFVFTWAWAACWGFVGGRICKSLRQKVMAKLMRMDLAYFEVHNPDINAALTTEISTVQLAISEKLGFAIQGVSYFIASVIVGFWLNAKLAGILLAAIIIPVGGIVLTAATLLGRFGREEARAMTEAGRVADESIKGAHVVQALNLQDAMVEKQDSAVKSAVRVGILKAAVGGVVLGCIFFVAYGGYGLAFYLGSQMISALTKQTGAPNVGTIFTIIFLILDSSLILGRIGPILQSIGMASRAAGAIRLILEHERPPVRNPRLHDIPLRPGPIHQIAFNQVSFSYPSRPQTILNNVVINFRIGCFNAVVGPSGAGKSTVCALLLRLYNPTQGMVLVNQIPLEYYASKSIGPRFALVQQHSTLFPGTVLDNLKLGFPDSVAATLSDKEITKRCIRAAKIANAYQFIQRLPEGINTVISAASGYGDLSGGEKQRLCLARALVAEPEVLVLDEPTASLDVKNQNLFMEALQQARAERKMTVIMITHRLDTVETADRIWLLHRGKVVERGSPEKLMRIPDGMFRRMVELQNATAEEETTDCYNGDGGVIDEEKSRYQIVHRRIASGGSIESAVPEEDMVTRSVTGVFRFCLELSRPELPFIILGLIGSIVTGCCVIAEAMLLSHMIETLGGKTKETDIKRTTNYLCLGFLGMGVLAIVSYTLSGTAFGIVSQRLMRRVRTKSFQHILRQDRAWAMKPENSASLLLSTLSSDTERLSALSGMTLGSIVSSIASLVAGVALGHIVAWRLAIVVLASVPAVLAAGFLRIRILQKFEAMYETAFLECAALASGACTSFSTVWALGKQEHMEKKFNERLSVPYKSVSTMTLVGSFFFAISIGIPYFAYALAYWWGGKAVREGHATTLQFFIVMFAILNGAQASGRMFSFSPEIVRAISAAQNVLRIWHSTPSIDNDELEDMAPKKTDSPVSETFELGISQPIQTGKGSSITFRDVHFRYRPDQPVLRGVNLIIPAGEFVAVVGQSGSGKSTVISLIERYWDVKAGGIVIDGQDIRQIPVALHRRRISIVPQESTLFSGSIASNISLGDPDFEGGNEGREAIIEVCKLCGIHNFISSLPEGYDTECGPNGTQLSGGQRQRICLARALINQHSSIILLDEAASALDAESEQLFEEAIQSLAATRRKTIVMVTHRLESIKKAGLIYFMEAGRVIESGTHQQLVALGGGYAALIEMQGTHGG